VSSGSYARQLDHSLEPLHRQLAEFNRQRLVPTLELSDWQAQLRREMSLRVIEGHFLEHERAQVATEAEAAPSDPRQFIDWFETLRETAAGQQLRFFQWLAHDADRDALSWFLTQEMACVDDPEDLFALAQLKLPWRPKIEMARCYWDEMGQGYAAAMRLRIGESLSHELQIDATEPPVWEALARSNLMLGLAINRRYGFHVIGALGALELTAAGPAKLLSAGLLRLGFSLEAGAYFASRAKLGVLRSYSWNQDIILPLVAQDSRCASAIAEGALMRLASSARCLRRYEHERGGAED